MTKIEIEKSELNALIKEGVKNALEKKDRPSIKRKRTKDSTVFLRKVEDKFIVDMDDKITIKLDKEKREILYSTFYIGEERKKKLMSFDEVRVLDKIKVEILEKKIDNEEIIGEPIPIVIHEDWKQKQSGTYAENIVVVPHISYKVKTDNGEILIRDNVINL